MIEPYKPPIEASTPLAGTGTVCDRTRTQCIVARCVAVAVLVSASLGLLYNLSSMPNILSRDRVVWVTPQYFDVAYWTMSLICIAFYAGLICYALRLWGGLPGSARAITCLLAGEVAYFFGISLLWLMPTIGLGVGAATGVANGGLMVQFLVLLPLWVPAAFLIFRLYESTSPIESG